MATITQMQYAIAVAKCGNFRRAAEECHVSQPSLSAQILKVESELEITIFDRSKQPIVLTEEGKKFLVIAKAIMSEYRNLKNINADFEASGEFVLGVIPTLLPYVVPKFLKDFSQSHPQVSLVIDELKTVDIIQKLHDDEIDAGLLVTPLYDDKIEETQLFYEPFKAFVADSHPYYHQSKLHTNNLDTDSIWLLDEGHCFRDQVMNVCKIPEKINVLTNVSFSGGTFETLINLIRKGEGYTILPLLATENLSEKELAKNIKEFVNPVPVREVSLVYTRTLLKAKIRKALSDSILKTIPADLIKHVPKKMTVVDI